MTVEIQGPSAGPFGEWVTEEVRTEAKIQIGGATADLYAQRSRSSIHRKAFDLALADLDHLIDLRPRRAESHYWRGLILLRHRRDARSAAEAFERAIAEDPGWHEAHLGLAEARLASGLGDKALASVDKILETRPWDGAARAFRGRVLLERNRPNEAIADLTTALSGNPWNHQIREFRAKAYEASGDPDRASRDRAVRLPSAMANDLAWKFVSGALKLRDPDAALPLAKLAVATAPQESTYHNTLGLTYYRLGRDVEAIAELRESLRLGNGKSDGFDLYVLSLAHHRQGQSLLGLTHFLRAVAWHLKQGSSMEPGATEELASFLVEALDGMFRLSTRR